jgi:hypothetical protein
MDKIIRVVELLWTLAALVALAWGPLLDKLRERGF